jgi:hypothetical protein
MARLTLEEINKIDIVDFLASIGITPREIKGHNYHYLSPLPGRNEKTPSFKVNRKLNRWWDFGTGEGSTLIDFGIRYYDCTIRELTYKLSGQPLPSPYVAHEDFQQKDETQRTIIIVQTQPIQSFPLVHYLWERRIPLDVAQQHCIEARYRFSDSSKIFYAIGFPCDAGGFELRSKYHKYSASPKSPTLISHNARDLAVFEGFFNMLTFLAFINIPDQELPDLLVLNSIAFFKKSLPVMDTYRTKHLFLDNDKAGDDCTTIALGKKAGYLDYRPLYKGYGDLNKWACNIGKPFIPPPPDLPVNRPPDP